ncbi:hypothetical protein POTOM_007568 [Populus tomentosa]|uniref:Uncharacterized protein n=1 Tax=Populus tomentosa TaxID=118781 RepID=A0A8X8DBV4_POPTO|nr:hypothetical protein POTOM_007568 [Populus tomentosa]
MVNSRSHTCKSTFSTHLYWDMSISLHELVDFSPNSTYLDLEMSCSTSSSILNTTNSNGATVYGAVPSNPTPSVAARINETPHFMSVTFLIVFLAKLTSSPF